MLNIILCCTAGMSTSMLVKKIKDAAVSKGIEVEVTAMPVSDAVDKSVDSDIILLGPQVRFQLDNVRQRKPNNKVDVIDMMAYGMMNGEKVLEQAMKINR